MIALSEHDALAQLQKSKASYQSFIKLNYESAAEDCKTCDTAGQCCTDEHFVNVHITRLEAVAIRETIERTPRLIHGKNELFTIAHALPSNGIV